MLLLDTCILISDALEPTRISPRCQELIRLSDAKGTLACSDISLWEISMLIQKGRISVDTDPQSFLELIIDARNISVLPITPKIAALSTTHQSFRHHDPADRLIAATAIAHNAALATFDAKLQKNFSFETIC